MRFVVCERSERKSDERSEGSAAPPRSSNHKHIDPYFFSIDNKSMNKNQNGYVTWLLIFVIVAVIAAVGGYVFYRHHQSARAQDSAVACQRASGASSCCTNDPIPGSIYITVPVSTKREEIQTLIKPIKGTVSFEGVAGDYEITVPAGSEKKALNYLRKLLIIQSAQQSTSACASIAS